jgi:hypothetical protein
MVHRNTRNLVDRRVLLEGVWQAHDQQLVRPLGRRAPEARLSGPASMIVILLLSLGLWFAIWEAVNKAVTLL